MYKPLTKEFYEKLSNMENVFLSFRKENVSRFRGKLAISYKAVFKPQVLKCKTCGIKNPKPNYVEVESTFDPRVHIITKEMYEKYKGAELYQLVRDKLTIKETFMSNICPKCGNMYSRNLTVNNTPYGWMTIETCVEQLNKFLLEHEIIRSKYHNEEFRDFPEEKLIKDKELFIKLLNDPKVVKQFPYDIKNWNRRKLYEF